MNYPLSVNTCADGSFSIDDSHREELVSVYDEECSEVKISLDDADRIVACVNALAGVEDAEPVKQLLDWMYLVSLRIQEGTIYQEELLEELDSFGFKIFGDDWKQGKDGKP